MNGEQRAEEQTEAKRSRTQTLEEKIAAKERQLADLKAAKKRLEAKARARESAATRKAENRRKILIGAMILAESEKSEESLSMLRKKLDLYLTRDDDRALFGMPQKKPEALDFDQLVAAVSGT